MIGWFIDFFSDGSLASADRLVREQVNGLWFVLSLELFMLFADRARRQWRYLSIKHPRTSIAFRFQQWRGHDVVGRAAIAWSVYFFGESVMRGWVWILLKLQNDGRIPLFEPSRPGSTVASFYPVAMVAAVLAVLGALCIIRMFAPDGMGKRAWQYALVAAVVFLAISRLF
jgi:hypothetical protein